MTDPRMRLHSFADSPLAAGIEAAARKAKLERQQKELEKEEPKGKLRLGCFEQPAAKKAKIEVKRRELAPLAPPAAAGNDGGEISVPSTANSAEKPAEKPAEKLLPEADLTEELDTPEARREREYFKGYFGEFVGPDKRMLLEEELGRGSFSSVFKCKDTKVGKDYAIKFIRSNKVLQKATEREIKLMRRLRSEASEKDPEASSCLLHLAGPEVFEHDGHLALVFHLQKSDLRTALYDDSGRGFSLVEVQGFAKNIFMALRALRRVRIIHNDLKPDNLLLSLDGKSVRLSDFGNCIDLADQHKRSYVRPAYCSAYRAPEILLGHSYSTRVDIWSAGATLFELAACRPLLLERTNNGMLEELLKICGPFPRSLTSSGKTVSRHFTTEGDFKLRKAKGPTVDEWTEELVLMGRYAKLINPVPPLLQKLVQRLSSYNRKQHAGMCKKLAELVVKCIAPDPGKRPGPEDILKSNAFMNSSAGEESEGEEEEGPRVALVSPPRKSVRSPPAAREGDKGSRIALLSPPRRVLSDTGHDRIALVSPPRKASRGAGGGLDAGKVSKTSPPRKSGRRATTPADSAASSDNGDKGRVSLTSPPRKQGKSGKISLMSPPRKASR